MISLIVVLEKILNIPTDYWMRFQSQYEKDKKDIRQKNIIKFEKASSLSNFITLNFSK